MLRGGQFFGELGKAGGRYFYVGCETAHAAFGHLIKKSGELIKLFLRNRVELMIVAAGTEEAHAKPHLGGSGHAVDDVLGAVFLVDNTALNGDGVVAIETGGDALLQRGVGEQIAGQLFDGELVEGEVAVVGVDNPITPRPHVAVGVVLVTVGVGIAGGIEPIARHMFAVARRGEEAVDGFLECLGRFVGEEGVEFGKGWGQSD